MLGVWGLIAAAQRRRAARPAAALLGSVAGLEVALREHLGGYRSHTLVLAGLCAVADAGRAVRSPGVARTAMLVGARDRARSSRFAGFRQLFKRRSGGVGMRVR